MDEKEPPFRYTHKELTTLLIKHEGIHEGHWAIQVEFGLGAGNFPLGAPDKSTIELTPAAIVGVTKIGIRRQDEPNPLTVDAAQVNPAGVPTSRPTPRRNLIRPKKEAQTSSSEGGAS